MATRKTSETKENAPASAQPQDFKELPEHTPGWELLKPFKQIKGSDQLRLLNRVQLMSAKQENSETGGLDFDVVADFIDYLSENFAVDPGAFDEWSSDLGGYERAMKLAVAYGEALGEAKRSAS